MTDPIVTYDFEFGFLNSTTQFYSAVDGRDRFGLDEQRVKLELHPDDATVDEIIITRSALAYLRTTKRTVTPPTQLEQDLGRLTFAETPQ